MIYAFSTILLLYLLPILFTLEVHRHPIHSEWGIRLCDGVLVIGVGRTTLRIL